MELNEYNGYQNHCKNTEIDLKTKFEHKDAHNIDTMEHIMQRKEQEFIDHSLLAPEYMRDPNHFIMDLMNFPKTVPNTHPNNDNLPTDLHFHNSLFPVTTNEHQHHANETPKTPPTSVYMPLNNDFLMPVQKSYNSTVNTVGSVDTTGVKGVQQLLLTETNVNLDDASLEDDCDISRFNSRKILPHKKRISRKLRINHCDSDLQLNNSLDDHKLPHVEQLVGQSVPQFPLEDHKLPNVEQLVGRSIQQFPLEDHKLDHVDQLVGRNVQPFRCELCGHATCSQLEFFAHLKQHYEPSTPDTILAAMKTSLEALGPEKTEEASDLCVINKKTDGLDQVFQDVHFPFDNFPQNQSVDEVTVVMEPQHHIEAVDIKMVNTNLDEAINATTSALQHQTQPQHQQQQPQTTPNLVSEEFSDTEDMLEGIRDKVLIEDTCDTMDLMTPTSNGVRPHWFTNTCFNGMDLKTKPFCDVIFSGQFAPMLNAETTQPVMHPGSHLQDTKLMAKEMHQSPANLQPPPPTSLQSHMPPPQVQHATDLRLHFTHPQPSINHEPSSSLSDSHVIQNQHIKIEDTQQADIRDIPNFQNSEETLSSNEQQDQPYHNPHQKQELEEDYKAHIEQQEREAEAEFYKRQQHKIEKHEEEEEEEYYESLNGDNPEDFCSENDEDDDADDDDDDDDKEKKRPNRKRKKFACTKCQRIFNSGNALKYHYRTHSGLRPHHCDICDKSFFAIGALKAHTRTHTGDKPFDCNYCDRKFRQWGDLKYHTISIHSTEKNHQCEFCGKSFSRKYSLVVHLRIHTSERNYKCEFCTKTFRASTYLQNHRKIHTGEKPYECEVCLKKFRVSGDMRRHQRIHERKRLKQDLLDSASSSVAKSTVCM